MTLTLEAIKYCDYDISDITIEDAKFIHNKLYEISHTAWSLPFNNSTWLKRKYLKYPDGLQGWSRNDNKSKHKPLIHYTELLKVLRPQRKWEL